MKPTRTILILLLALTLSACAGIRPAPPEVQLAGLEITDVSLSHANFLATLKLFNPNSVSMDIKGLQFTLFLNDTRVAKGLTAKSFSIPAEEYGEAAIRLSSSFLDLFQLTRSLQGQEAISFRIAGEVKVGGLGLISSSIPIEREGTLPLTGTLNQLRSNTLQPSPMESIGEQIINK
ncbi:MAG: LEA type 2 family protein [Desulfuromonadales bacterium]|nr:LEA type 2 family protein [Desulfuromonadales bacterium]